MGKVPFACCLATLVLSACGCSGGGGTNVSTTSMSNVGRVSGTVMSVSVLSGPVKGAHVEALDGDRRAVAVAVTDARGRFAMGLRGGRYTFDVSSNHGCVFHPVSAVVAVGQRVKVELRCDVP
jgi:hypothetical protein